MLLFRGGQKRSLLNVGHGEGLLVSVWDLLPRPWADVGTGVGISREVVSSGVASRSRGREG